MVLTSLHAGRTLRLGNGMTKGRVASAAVAVVNLYAVACGRADSRRADTPIQYPEPRYPSYLKPPTSIEEVLPHVRDIRRIGSAALDLVRVADGSVDAYAESGLNAWDLAAGWLIAEEAGAVVVGEGERPGKALTVAAGPALVEQVRELFVGGADGD